MLTLDPPVVVEVIRGEGRESFHRGEAAVADASGRILFALGNPYRMTFIRSAAKPVQAMTVVETGAAGRFALTPAELAVICASHSAEAHHLEAVRAILRKIGLGPGALACGVHPPLDPVAAGALAHGGCRPGPLQNNCSGKHVGMLAVCRHRSWPVEGYLAPDHPLQVLNRANLAFMAGLDPGDLVEAADGCGAPTHALPLAAMARAYARLADPAGLPEAKQAAARAVAAAMQSHPEMVGGTGRLTTRLMRAAGRLLAKSGAEGVYCVGMSGPGWGLALKVEDGGSRAVPPAVVEFLLQLGALDGPAASALADLHRPVLRNHRGDVAGAVRPVARLRWVGNPDRGKETGECAPIATGW